MRAIALLAVLLAAACAPVAQGAVLPTPVLHPYFTLTPSATLDWNADSVISAETPLPSPTPASYTIKSGDTLSQIAEKHRVSVDSLLLANPGLAPNALRVGETLAIPAGGNTAPAAPTPAALQILDVACRPMATGAAWCFALIHNDSAEWLESVTGVISISDSSGTALASQDVALLLDVLPPGATLPLAVPFSGPLPPQFKPQVRILTALRLASTTERYLPASLRNVFTKLSWSGRTAEVSGEVILPSGTLNASEVWLAALAYDGGGELIGWRRWEGSGGLSAGSAAPFQFSVYSLAGAIERVDLIVQARR